MVIFNFSAGPALIPKPVLEKAQKALLDYKESGMSILEMSHRSDLVVEMMAQVESLLRDLMSIPDHYKVLFLQGGASTQFTMIPMNLARGKKAYYHIGGVWGKKAYTEAFKLSELIDFEPQILASSEDVSYQYLPVFDANRINPDGAYLHLTTNNTIEGTSLYSLPDSNGLPIVADMSSNLLAFPYKVEEFGLIYASAQKNLGIAGLTVLVIREDLVETWSSLPHMMAHETHIQAQSRYNTPPVFGIYMAGLVLEWLKEEGGVPEITRRNHEKAALLYDCIDQSSFYHSPVQKREERSLTTIPFRTPSSELDELFIQKAEACGLMNLRGHASVGGMRACLYNGFPLEGVHALIQFMADFEAIYQKRL